MGPCQRETRCIVVKSHICIAGRMASQTCIIIVIIATNGVMLLVRFGIFVTRNAGERFKITGIGVAFGTIIPNAFMFTRVNREKLRIVGSKVYRFPTRI